MPYTFGGVGDDVTISLTGSGMASGSATFVAGWFYPTALVNPDAWWSFGNFAQCRTPATTSELGVVTDNATTDGVWTTSGAGISTGKWWFLAWLFTATNTGPAGALRCWIGDELTAPVEATVTQTTAPAGNYTGNTSSTVGNAGTNTVAFTGDVGPVTSLVQTVSSGGGPLPLATAGTITQAEADLIAQRLVQPLWAGADPVRWASNGSPDAAHRPMDSAVAYRTTPGAIVAPMSLATVAGATLTQNRPGRLLRPNWLHTPNVRR